MLDILSWTDLKHSKLTTTKPLKSPSRPQNFIIFPFLRLRNLRSTKLKWISSLIIRVKKICSKSLYQTLLTQTTA